MENAELRIIAEAWLGHVVVGGFQQTLLQLLYLVAPFCVFAVVLHLLERVVQSNLAKRFGWRSVLWTGWLGTPVHEGSHALFCLIFRHRIVSMALFRPDREAGRLGYVKHSYNPRNLYHVAGNFFIGIAPLIGGTLVLYVLLWIFYPGVASSSLSGDAPGLAIVAGDFVAPAKLFVRQAGKVIFGVITPFHLISWQFWLFLYLVLCVGSHLAPSKSDYHGGRWGAALLLAMLLMANWIFLAFGGDANGLLSFSARVVGPALAMFALCVALCTAAALVVFGITMVVKYLAR